MRNLPFNIDYKSTEVLENLSKANNKIGELNGISKLLPNPNIILNAVILGEAKESSEIENIVTTFDNIFKEITLKNYDKSSKEVVNYRQAILHGFKLVKEKGYISTNMIEEIHHIIEPNVGGIRKIPGTKVINTKTNEILHIPPQNEIEIRDYLSNLEKYMNINELEEIDPLIKMSIMHYQFECIHPFHDGNGRVGRLLNILYLVLSNKLSLPILYLSKYINENKSEYYSHLQNMSIDDKYFKDYLLFMLNGIRDMSEYTIIFINKMINMMKEASIIIEDKCPKIYSKELVEYLFYDFYTKNEYIRNALSISRNTASKYLHMLVDAGILIEEKVGKETLFKNAYLYELIKSW